MKARAALAEAQSAAARFEKASGAHDAAKEMVTLAEEGFMERGVVQLDQACQEMVNHATKRVNESEIERNLSAEEHRVKSKLYQIAEQRVHALQRSLKRSINKSRYVTPFRGPTGPLKPSFALFFNFIGKYEI